MTRSDPPWRWLGLSVLVALLTACGGAGSSGSVAPSDGGTPPPDSSTPRTPALAFAVSGMDGVTVESFTLVSSQRVGRTTFDYTYTVTARNGRTVGLQNVAATVTSVAASTVVTDGQLNFGDIPIGATARSTDTFTIRQDRLVPFSVTDLNFALVEIGVSPTSSRQLIDQALANGEIDDETALVYKVYVAFGDDRLPSQYKGDDSLEPDSLIMGEVAGRIDSLSPQNRAILEPFLVPPVYADSWWVQQQVATGQAATARQALAAGRVQPAADPPCPGCPSALWGNVALTNGHVKVWWQLAVPGDQTTATTILNAVESTIWPKETALMDGREPLSDSGQAQNGGDGLLDIYLAVVPGRALTVAYKPGCKVRPTFIVINPQATRQMRSVVAHEFLHTLQFTYNVHDACTEYDWLGEATANWAMDFVYPADNYEHEWANGYLHFTETGLEQKDYAAYLLPFYLARSNVDAIVAGIWDKTPDFDSLQAIDEAIPGGFKERWPEFALYNWNRGSVHHYRDWDQLDWSDGFHGAALAFSQPSRETPVDGVLKGVPDVSLPLDQLKSSGQVHLSSTYFHYAFPNDDVRTVVFYNGTTWELNEKTEPDLGTHLVPKAWSDTDRDLARVQAIVKVGGQWKDPEDWSGLGQYHFCRDKAKERVEELVLIFSNAQYKDRNKKLLPADKPPTLWLSNMSCAAWTGTTDFTSTIDGVTQTLHGDVTWTPTGNGTYYLASGTLHWTISGTDTGDCTYSGSDSVPIEASVDTNRSLATFNDYSAGNYHRAYGGFGYSNSRVNYKATCPAGSEGDFETLFLTQAAGIWFPGFGELPYSVGTDGNMIDGLFIDQGAGRWDWHFTAQRE